MRPLSAWARYRPLRFEQLEDRRLLAVITVNTLLDEDDGSGVGAVSFRDALADANPNDTIDFDVVGTISLTNGELIVNKQLTITGPGAHRLTIDAGRVSRVFNVNDGNASTLANVAISGLTITGGNVLDDGGGIRNSENLSLTACHITGNSAEDGGGIANFSGTFAIFDSTISNNTAFGANGGGAGIFNFSSTKTQTSTITNSTISSNTTTITGGGVYNFLGTLIISYSTITQNDAPANRGSGVASWGDTNVASTQISSSIVAGNLHTDVDIIVGFQPTFASGGYNLVGFGNSTGSFTFTGDQRNVADPLLGSLADNGGPTPTHLPLVGSPAIDTGNPAVNPPGGFDQRRAPHVRVFDGNGDSVARIDKGAVERDTVLFEVSTLTDENDADFSLGDFSLREAIGQASLVTVGTPAITFSSLLTSGGPATIQLALGQLEIAKGMVIEGPGASLLTIDAHHASRVMAVDDLNDNSRIEVRISGLTLANGTTVDYGGGVYSQERLTISNSVVSGSVANYGGGIYNTPQGLFTLDRSRVTGNSSTAAGGGIYNWGGQITIVESVITANHTDTDGGGLTTANDGYVSIHSSTFSNNAAMQNGGGISNGAGFLDVTASTISGNVAVAGGGLLVNTPNNQRTRITSSTVSSNIAPQGGAGINNLNGQLLIEFSTITRNVANDFAGSGVRSAPSAANAPTSFYSTIIAGNYDPNGDGQPGRSEFAVGGAVNSLISLGYNVVGQGGFVDETFTAAGDQKIELTDPKLGPLADNGGPTLTHALLSGSPALDHGDPNSTIVLPKYDQRGKPFARIRDGDLLTSIVMDVGAFEAQSIPPVLLGDYNLNGTVDLADYVVWRKTGGGSVAAYSGADGNGDGVIDQVDYRVWRSSFGNSMPPAAATAAEVVANAGTARASESEVSQPPTFSVLSSIPIANVPFVSTAKPSFRVDVSARSQLASAVQRDAALLAWYAELLDAPSNRSSTYGSSDFAGKELGSAAPSDISSIDAAIAAMTAGR